MNIVHIRITQKAEIGFLTLKRAISGELFHDEVEAHQKRKAFRCPVARFFIGFKIGKTQKQRTATKKATET
jgi:hypothetical protein